MSDSYEVKFRYKNTNSNSRSSVSSTRVKASNSSDARNQVISSRSSGKGIDVISVEKKR